MEVLETTPVEGSLGTPEEPSITATFSDELDPRTLNEDTFTLHETLSGARVDGQVLPQGKVAALVPARPLKAGTSYLARLSPEVAGQTLGRMKHSRTWAFTVRGGRPGMDPIQLISPSQFAEGRVSVSLPRVRSNERVVVIPVHVSQDADGLDYLIRATGLASSRATGTTSALKAEDSRNPAQKRRNMRGNANALKSHLKRLADFIALHNQRIEEMNSAAPSESPRPEGPGRSRSQGVEKRKQALSSRQESDRSFGKCRGPYEVDRTRCTLSIQSEPDVYSPVAFTLRHESPSALWLVADEDASDLTKEELKKLADKFESVVIASTRRYFGDLTDSDGNGKLCVAFSRKLLENGNNLLGYAAPWDLRPHGTYKNLPSNEGEFIYIATPQALVAQGTPRDEALNLVIPTTLAHELKHAISNGNRVLENRKLETLWLEEPSAVASEELAGLGTQISLDTQGRAAPGLKSPEKFPLAYTARPEASDAEAAMYGYNFLMLWRVAERVGHDRFWKDWTASRSVGIEGLEQAAGMPFRSILLDWSLTLLLDHARSLPGYDYKSLNLRDGDWEPLGVRKLEYTSTVSMPGIGYYAAAGRGSDARIEIQSDHPAPYFLIVRQPL